MKVFKRNMVIITVLMFVCVAVYLNWSYNRGEAKKTSADELSTAVDLTEEPENASYAQAGLYYEALNEDIPTDMEEEYLDGYFATARLSRQQARDSAISILEETANYEGASQETIDGALSEIAAMASYTMTESQIENVLLAKGFTDCVVFMSGDGVNVIVPSPLEGLSSASVARITDTVTAESGLSPELIKIIEVK